MAVIITLVAFIQARSMTVFNGSDLDLSRNRNRCLRVLSVWGFYPETCLLMADAAL